MKFPIRVDATQGELLMYDADNELVSPWELAEEANRLSNKVEELQHELRGE